MKPVATFAVVFYLALVVGFAAVAVVRAQQPAADATAAVLDQLGACNAERGNLQRVQALVVGGRLLSLAQYREKFEAANPGKTISDAFVVQDRPAAK